MYKWVVDRINRDVDQFLSLYGQDGASPPEITEELFVGADVLRIDLGRVDHVVVRE
jgi:hypothetical protein